MASHDQRQRYSADDQAKALAQERAGVVVGSIRIRAKEKRDPIYDAIQEAKEAVEHNNKAQEAAQKAQEDSSEYGEDKDREQLRLMAATGTLVTDKEDDEVEITEKGGTAGRNIGGTTGGV